MQFLVVACLLAVVVAADLEAPGAKLERDAISRDYLPLTFGEPSHRAYQGFSNFISAPMGQGMPVPYPGVHPGMQYQGMYPGVQPIAYPGAPQMNYVPAHPMAYPGLTIPKPSKL